MDPPFITLVAGGMQAKSSELLPSSENVLGSSPQRDSTPALSLPLVTHDTSRTKYHIAELGTFAARLENAAAKIFPNKGRSRYKGVHVLLLRWEEDSIGVEYELNDLAKTFRSAYGFETETWLIPTFKPSRTLSRKASQFIDDFGNADNLLIVYYAGHGLIDDSRQAVWSCKSGNHASLKWSAIQTLFEEADSDVLLLLDCCAAASGAPTDGESPSVIETIAACGFETSAPFPGRHSFTNTLISVLEDWKWRTAFTAAMLHCEILKQLRHEKPERYRNTAKFEFRKSPIHIVSTNDPHARSIELSPRRTPSHIPNDIPPSDASNARGASFSRCLPNAELDKNEFTLAASIPEAANFTSQTGDLYDINSLAKILHNGDTALPHVLIKVALEEEPESTLNFELWKRWLQQFPGLAKYVKVQGVYKSNSTLIILSVPVVLWDWLPEDPACEFIGHVHSDNILSYVTSVSRAVGRHVESDEPLKYRSDKSTPVSSVLHSGTQTSTSPRSANEPASSHRLTKTDDGPNYLENSWYPEFSRLRELQYDKTLPEHKEEADADGDNLSIFFTDLTDTASCELEVLEEFCRGMSFKDIASGKGDAGYKRAVWLDDRVNHPDLKGSGEARQYPNPLTATGLYRALKSRRFDHEDFPDAARRLIYITDLDSACIYALAATASFRQTPVLRDAIYKHLTFQTSIAVRAPSAEFSTFHLHLHLPFFLLRKSAPPEESPWRVNTKPRRGWTDLSFLALDTPESQDQYPSEVWGIHEAQISCVVTGSDDWRWVGYGFVDTEIDGFLTDLSEDDLSLDQIAAGEFEASMATWNPRDYWLRVFEIRIDQVRKEWEYLIHRLEQSANQYKNKHPFTLSRRSGTARELAEEMKEAFDWTLQINGLLRRLDGVLSDTVEAWKSFNAPHDGISDFQCTDTAAISPDARRALCAIKAIFRQLEGYQKRMALLNQRCSDFSRALELRLILEGKEAADNNGINSELTVSILYPIALTAGIFSMRQEVIPVDLNPGYFVIVVFIVTAIVHAIRMVIGYASLYWVVSRRKIAVWMKKRKLGEHGLLENQFRDRFSSRTGTVLIV